MTNTNARSQKHLPVSTILKIHEKQKKKAYNSRIMNVKHGTFSPLAFSLTGDEGPEISMFHKHIAQKIANKTSEKYKKVQTLETLLFWNPHARKITVYFNCLYVYGNTI